MLLLYFVNYKMNTRLGYRISGEIINMSSFRRLFYYQILRFATVTLSFLASSAKFVGAFRFR